MDADHVCKQELRFARIESDAASLKTFVEAEIRGFNNDQKRQDDKHEELKRMMERLCGNVERIYKHLRKQTLVFTWIGGTLTGILVLKIGLAKALGLLINFITGS